MLITNFPNGWYLTFEQGKFDNWCVYLRHTNGYAVVPKDEEYFEKVLFLSNNFDANKVYNDFLKIYNNTSDAINLETLNNIYQISRDYGQYADLWWLIFTIIYAAMIAEENKEHAILKKRIKALGIYQVLFENFSPYQASIFSKKKNWKELDIIMKERNI